MCVCKCVCLCVYMCVRACVCICVYVCVRGVYLPTPRAHAFHRLLAYALMHYRPIPESRHQPLTQRTEPITRVLARGRHTQEQQDHLRYRLLGASKVSHHSVTIAPQGKQSLLEVLVTREPVDVQSVIAQ